jgi:hypothetical protein
LMASAGLQLGERPGARQAGRDAELTRESLYKDDE